MNSPRLRRLLPLFLILALGAVAYARCVRAPFIFDDTSIQEDPQVRRLWPPTAALAAPKDSPLAGRPVVAYSLAINYALGGYNPRGYHVFNLVIHLLCGLALFGVVRCTLLTPRLRDHLGTAAVPLATTVACIWVVHPLASEPVVYVLQRTESLATLFYLLTLWCALRAWASPPSAPWAAAAVAACALGAGSKEIAYSLPLMVLLMDRTLVSRSFGTAFKRHRWLYVGLGGAWVIMAVLYAAAPRGRSVGLHDPTLPPLDYLRTQAGVIVWYLRLCFWPHPLSIIYDWPVVRSWAAAAAPGLLVLTLLGATAWALWRRWPVGLAGALFFLVLAPSSSWVPMLTEIAAERRMYLPLAAVVSVVVVGAYATVRSAGPTLGRMTRMALPGAAVVVIVILSIATAARVAQYRTPERIWRSALGVYPNSLRALGNLGAVLVRAGHDDDAIVVFRRMLEISPDRFDARIACANALFRLGRFAPAVPLYRRALAQQPAAPQAVDAQLSLADCLAWTGHVPEARAELDSLLAHQPAGVPAHETLAALLLHTGQTQEAVEQLRLAVNLKPQSPDLHAKLGGALLDAGQIEPAAQEIAAGLGLDRDSPAANLASARLLLAQGRPTDAEARARAYTASPGFEATAARLLGLALAAQGRTPEAERWFRQVLRREPRDADAHHNLAVALAQEGNLRAAADEFAAALALDPGNPARRQDLAKALRMLGRGDDATRAERPTAAVSAQ